MGCNKSKHAAVASGNTVKMAQRRPPLTRICKTNPCIKKNDRTVPVAAMEEPDSRSSGYEGDVKSSIRKAVNGVEKKQTPVEVKKVENKGSREKEVKVKMSGAPSSVAAVAVSMEDVDKKAEFDVEKVNNNNGAEQNQVTVEINDALWSAAVVGISREDVVVMENVEKKALVMKINNGVEEKEVEVEVSGAAFAWPVAVVGSGENIVMVNNNVGEEEEEEEEAMVEVTAVVAELNGVETGKWDEAVVEVKKNKVAETAGETDGAKQVVEEEVEDEGVGQVVVGEVNAEEDAGWMKDEVDDGEANNDEGGEIAVEEEHVLLEVEDGVVVEAENAEELDDVLLQVEDGVIVEAENAEEMEDVLLQVEDGVVVEAENAEEEEGNIETVTAEVANVAEKSELSNTFETIKNVTAEDEELIKGCSEAADVWDNAQSSDCHSEAAIMPDNTELSNTSETVTDVGGEGEEVKATPEANMVEIGQSKKCGGCEATEDEATAAAYDQCNSCNVVVNEVITEACSNSCSNETEVVIGGGHEAPEEELVLDANAVDHDLSDSGDEAVHEVVEATMAETSGSDDAVKEPELAVENAQAEEVDGSVAVKNDESNNGGAAAEEEAISAEGQFMGADKETEDEPVLDANVVENDLSNSSGEAEHAVVLETSVAETSESDDPIKDPEPDVEQAQAEEVDSSVAMKNGQSNYGGAAAEEEAICAEGQSGICSEAVEEAATDANTEANNSDSSKTGTEEMTEVVVTETNAVENGQSNSGEFAATEEALMDANVAEADLSDGGTDVILDASEDDEEPEAVEEAAPVEEATA